MDRYRLISSIVVLFVYLLAMFPIQTICTAIVLCIAYFILKNIGPGRLGEYSAANNGREIRRRNALKLAQVFLSPYKDIWRNLKLSNKHCSLMLGSNASSISAREKNAPYRKFTVIRSNVHPYEELWNLFCTTFEHTTTYDRLLELCNTFNVSIIEESKPQKRAVSSASKHDIKYDTIEGPKNDEKKEKLDINNASEIEITALPGISIVLAKKIIKKREEIGGFKSVKDVCLFLHLKPHIEKQIRELIYTGKMKGSVKVDRYQERRIDL